MVRSVLADGGLVDADPALFCNLDSLEHESQQVPNLFIQKMPCMLVGQSYVGQYWHNAIYTKSRQADASRITIERKKISSNLGDSKYKHQI